MGTIEDDGRKLDEAIKRARNPRKAFDEAEQKAFQAIAILRELFESEQVKVNRVIELAGLGIKPDQRRRNRGKDHEPVGTEE